MAELKTWRLQYLNHTDEDGRRLSEGTWEPIEQLAHSTRQDGGDLIFLKEDGTMSTRFPEGTWRYLREVSG